MRCAMHSSLTTRRSFLSPSDGLASSERVRDARVSTTATLVPDEDASLCWFDARNVLIEGDNLQVLNLLKNGYSCAIKLIYIDGQRTGKSRISGLPQFLLALPNHHPPMIGKSHESLRIDDSAARGRTHLRTCPEPSKRESCVDAQHFGCRRYRTRCP